MTHNYLLRPTPDNNDVHVERSKFSFFDSSVESIGLKVIVEGNKLANELKFQQTSP